jgi:hypothetical protein
LKINSTTLNQFTYEQNYLQTYKMAEHKQEVDEGKIDQYISNSQDSSITESRKRKTISEALVTKSKQKITPMNDFVKTFPDVVQAVSSDNELILLLGWFDPEGSAPNFRCPACLPGFSEESATEIRCTYIADECNKIRRHVVHHGKFFEHIKIKQHVMEKKQRKVDPDRHLITKKTYICGSTFTKYCRPCQKVTEGFKYCREHCIPEDNNALSNNSWFYDYESENLKWIKKDLAVLFLKHGYAHQLVCEYEMRDGYNPAVGEAIKPKPWSELEPGWGNRMEEDNDDFNCVVEQYGRGTYVVRLVQDILPDTILKVRGTLAKRLRGEVETINSRVGWLMGERTENMMDTTFETSHDQVMAHYPLLNLVRHPEWNGHLATLECLLQSYTILVGLYQREAGDSEAI